MSSATDISSEKLQLLKQQIREWALEMGFQQVGFCDTDLQQAEDYLQEWVEAGFHGEMDYMHKHGEKRTRPAALEPHTQSVISLRMVSFGY